jgi:hypothetical protein
MLRKSVWKVWASASSLAAGALSAHSVTKEAARCLISFHDRGISLYITKNGFVTTVNKLKRLGFGMFGMYRVDK